MQGWLALVPGPPVALIGKHHLGGSIGQGPRPLPSGTVISRVPFARESEPRQLSSRTPRSNWRGRQINTEVRLEICNSLMLTEFGRYRTEAAIAPHLGFQSSKNGQIRRLNAYDPTIFCHHSHAR